MLCTLSSTSLARLSHILAVALTFMSRPGVQKCNWLDLAWSWFQDTKRGALEERPFLAGLSALTFSSFSDDEVPKTLAHKTVLREKAHRE